MPKGSGNGGAPESQDFDPFIVPASTFLINLATEDDFNMEISGTGKGKIIDLPDGDQLSISPGFEVTFKNLDNGSTVTLNATGSFRTSVDGATTTIVANGHNVAADPQPPGNGEGVFYLTGHFTWSFIDPDPSDPDDDIFVPISGNGQIAEIIQDYLL